MASAVSTSTPAGSTDSGHRLNVGVQVRAEKKGLLFYYRKGPRLYFISSGELLTPDYFGSGCTLGDWLSGAGIRTPAIHTAISEALAGLVEKGVLDAD